MMTKKPTPHIKLAHARLTLTHFLTSLYITLFNSPQFKFMFTILKKNICMVQEQQQAAVLTFFSPLPHKCDGYFSLAHSLTYLPHLILFFMERKKFN
jgi:hypothetical protein